ncbi:MAG: DUF4340 domain-containing protein [Chloroflexi bacterium]|nr:DUF4340 domain-containing protein [Chloroflexota bacterium]
MNFRLTVVLLVILAAVAGVAYYVNQQPEAKPESAVEAETVVYEEKVDDVVGIEIRAKDKTVALERVDDQKWRLSAPEAAEADDLRVFGLAAQMATVRAARRIGDSTDIGQYGLDQPTYVVTLRLKDGRTRQLLVGKDNPLGNGSYAKLPDAPTVYLLQGTVPAIQSAVADPPKMLPTPTPAPVPSPTP